MTYSNDVQSFCQVIIGHINFAPQVDALVNISILKIKI